MKKLKLILVSIFILISLTGCANKGDVTETKLLEVETVTRTYIKFITIEPKYKFNSTLFFNDSIINKIKEDKIKEGDILKVKFGYYDWISYDNILDYEIISRY